MSFRRPFALLAVALVLAACAAPGATTRPTGTPAAVTPTAPATATAAATATAVPATASPAATATAAATPTAAPDACAGDLPLKNPGRLTLSTDNPAFQPWFNGDPAVQYPNEPDDAPVWEFNDPYSMDGFEGAMAYAVADAMGFAPDEIDWIPNAVFAQAFAPGEKAFDFHMAQIAITDQRAQAVDFSDPYLDSNQALLALTTNEITAVTSIEELKDFRLGAASNTTSFEFIENVIQPTVEPSVVDDNTAAVAALNGDTVDGIVVDLASAFFMRDAQVDNFDTEEPEGTIVGQFGPPAEPDHVGFVLELGSPLTACVNQSIAAIKADGTHETILDEWINTGQAVPFLE